MGDEEEGEERVAAKKKLATRSRSPEITSSPSARSGTSRRRDRRRRRRRRRQRRWRTSPSRRVKKLQEALNKLLRRAKSTKSGSRRGSTAAEHDADERSSSSSSSGSQLLLPLDRFLNCPSSLEVDRRVAAADGEFSPDTQIILSKARDLLVNTNGGGAIKQKSFRFLLKKMFVCRGGFSPSPAPPPTLKDPVESRIEKLFRTMLHKRMNARPSNAAASSSRKYYLEDKPREKMQREHLHDDEDDDENAEDIFKWDKTDSDCNHCSGDVDRDARFNAIIIVCTMISDTVGVRFTI
ncbi:hypothetical protein OsJ_25119 [Oryza sativa Japonica Group]|uniref:Uncharacterized protein n=1 Tax=Oryza sativa subsp. japonica TaxID=39947 RepID=B9FU80_ORYSJ|nr:hypothetical protein OsJ_25119 [Oryza sativa Japonica Group]